VILLTVWLGAGAGLCSLAQSSSMLNAGVVSSEIPEAPDAPVMNRSVAGAVFGTVLDVNGDVVEGAVVTLEEDGVKAQQTTDSMGSFQFTSVKPGDLRLNISANGFTAWVSKDVVLRPGEDYDVPAVELNIASAITEVQVKYSQHEVAEDEVRAEEKQRVLGVIPNFYVSYVWNAAPLSTGQKYRLAWRTSIDPVSIGFSGAFAGVEQWQNYMSGYGQGAQGYAKRFGASFADGTIGTMLGGAVLPSILHQDPRYFYKGTGSISSRILYAMASVVICKGDNGHWQPNYSNVLGNMAAAGISNLYYPSTNREGVRLMIDNSLIGTASGAIGSLFQEFLIKRISRGVSRESAQGSVR